MILNHAQSMHHRNYGDLDKCISVMERMIHHATDDNELIYQAKIGILKRSLNVGDREMTQPSGRKKFLINIMNDFNASNSKLHKLAHYESFCFHVSQLNLGNIYDLINESLPDDKKISRSFDTFDGGKNHV